jgi:hypothetical protein
MSPPLAIFYDSWRVTITKYESRENETPGNMNLLKAMGEIDEKKEKN